MTSILRLENVTKRFNSVVAVDSVGFEVRKGELLTLLGPSGSGKSTILSIIAGFERPTSGEVFLGDAPQSRVPAYKRDIGVVFQNYALFPHLSVFENVAFALRNLRWRRAEIERRVAELLDLIQLKGLETRAPSQLSGGQQQRVALARALAPRPSLLLLDEPLSALDKKLREHMLAEFQRIHLSLGVTMLFVTHDQEEALAMSDRIAVMNEGRIIQIGAPDEIYQRPAAEFVADFIGDANLWPGLARDGGRLELEGGWTVECPHREADRTPILALVRPEQITLEPGPNSIEARVVQTFYFGDSTKYVLAADRGLKIAARVVNRPGAAILKPDDRTTVSWTPAVGRVIVRRRSS